MPVAREHTPISNPVYCSNFSSSNSWFASGVEYNGLLYYYCTLLDRKNASFASLSTTTRTR